MPGCILSTQRNLIVDRTVSLKIARKSSIDRGAICHD
jgi:hypothetical protein